MKKLISVIVPVYNVEKYVEQCVRSIMSQTYEKLEIILVDDGAKDNSGAICDRLAEEDKRIRVIHKENGGVSSARNAGIDVAQGEWIAFVDGDDYIDPTMYEKLAAKMTDDVDISFCCIQADYEDGRVKSFLSEANALEKVIQKPYDIMPILRWTRDIKLRNEETVIMGASAARSLFRKRMVLGFKLRFPENIRMGEDRLFMMSYLSLCKKGDLVAETLYHYRKNNSDSATASAHTAYLDFEHEKSKLLLKAEIIEKNNFYTRKEKDHLQIQLAQEFYYAFVTAQMGSVANYREELKKFHEAEVVKKP